ncbi:MAG: sialate O-acetylesterase [Bacteroidota bacterium]
MRLEKMSFSMLIPLLINVAIVVSCTNMQETKKVDKKTQASDPNFHIYLCFGQSNMEGSAAIEEQDKEVDKRLLMMASMDCNNLGRQMYSWYPAIPPLSQCGVGLSPADYFGRTMVAKLPDSIRVGLVNVAVGGCDIRLFDKDIYQDYDSTFIENWFLNKIADYGGNPYKRLVDLAKVAQKEGVIKGIILHQGEANTGDSLWPNYVKRVYENLLADLDLGKQNIPLIAGEVVHEEYGGICSSMNPIIKTLPEVIPNALVVSSKGCPARSDSLHFNSEGVRELGKRYALKMIAEVNN